MQQLGSTAGLQGEKQFLRDSLSRVCKLRGNQQWMPLPSECEERHDQLTIHHCFRSRRPGLQEPQRRGPRWPRWKCLEAWCWLVRTCLVARKSTSRAVYKYVVPLHLRYTCPCGRGGIWLEDFRSWRVCRRSEGFR